MKTISAATIWTGPSLDGLANSWRDDPIISTLAPRIAARRTSMADADAAIDDYAHQLGANRQRKLTLLFAAALEIIDDERAALIRGIHRYTKRQQALADQIRKRAADLDQLGEGTSQDVAAKREMLLEAQNWDTRIFDDRRRVLPYVCEQPQVLEQRIYALAKKIEGDLK